MLGKSKRAFIKRKIAEKRAKKSFRKLDKITEKYLVTMQIKKG